VATTPNANWSNRLEWIHRNTAAASGAPGVILDDWNVPEDQSWLVRLILFWNKDIVSVQAVAFALSGLGGLYAPLFAQSDFAGGEFSWLVGVNVSLGAARSAQPNGFLIPSGGTLRLQLTRSAASFPAGTTFNWQIYYQVMPPQLRKFGRQTVDNEQVP
jgi:hypothetical protein